MSVRLLKAIVVSGVALILLGGCAFFTHQEQIGALEEFGSSQDEIQDYVSMQEAFFNKLKSDVQNQLIREGAAKSDILATYGEPVFCKQSRIIPGETCLYRNPVKYFSTDKVYLYFGPDEKLSSWKFIPK